jgi:hypothetical protein
VTLSVHLDAGRHPHTLAGVVVAGDGAEHPFSGVMELVAVFQRLLDEASPVEPSV